MASRAMRRAQGDALTRAAEEAFAGEDSSSSDSEDDAHARPTNAFALLLGSEDEVEDEDEEQEEQPEPEPEPEPTKAKKSKKKKKKKASVEPAEDAVDEVTAALRELGEEMLTTTLDLLDDPFTSSARGTHAVTARNALVAVDRNRMKAEDELKSIFGARAIRAVEAEEGGRGRTSSSRGGGGGHARSSRGAHTGHRSFLVTPKDTWPSAPSARGSGFVMQSLGVDVNGHAVFRFVHDDDRADARAAFERAKASHDPNALVRLLHYHPWNAQALLALADIHTYTGEGQRSAEMLERCVYAMEGAWHPAFAEAAMRGDARLGESLEVSPDDGSGLNADSEQTPTPNRTFLDAMFKHTQALTRRGCHRAALECAKLSLSLDRLDPTGLLCAVDYFALRCGETDWLLDFASEFREDGSLLALPGFAFSAALARMGGGRPGRVFGAVDAGARKSAGKSRRREKAKGDGSDESGFVKQETEDALLRALLMHPAALMALLQRIDSSAVNGDARWAAALTHPHFAGARDAAGNRGLEHLCDLFAERHHLLWKPDDALARLREACVNACAVVDDPDATVDGLRAPGYVAMLSETFPPGDAVRNRWAHLSTEDFSDVVKRQMPEGDENPFLARPADVDENDPDLLADAAAMLRGGQFDADAAAAAGLDPEALRAMAAHLQGGAGGAEMLERAREQIGDENPRALGLLDFFRTMLVPQDGGGGLQREIARQNAPPREDRED